jgi:hypothetical protein
MLMLLALPVALLAGRTTQALLGPNSSAPEARELCRGVLKRVAAFAVLLAVGTALLNYAAWQQGRAGQGSVASTGSVLAWLGELSPSAFVYWGLAVLIFLPIALWLLRRDGRLQEKKWAWSWGAVLLAELWAFNWPLVAVRCEAEIYAPSESLRFLAQQRAQKPQEHWRTLDRGLPGLPSSSPLGSALALLGDNRIEAVLGYNSFDVRRYKEYLQLVTDEDRPLRPREGIFGYPIIEAFKIRNKNLLDLLGTRYLAQPRGQRLEIATENDPGTNQGWTLVFEDPHPSAYSFLAGGIRELPPYQVFENHASFPRAFIVHSAKPLAERTKVLQQLRTADFEREVFLEGDIPSGPHRDAVNHDREQSAITEYRPNRIVVQTDTPEPGFLVLTDVWFPGWRCTVDGQPGVVQRANFLFRAIALPAGKHEVIFAFAPASYEWGKRISLAGLAGVALAGLLSAGSWRRRLTIGEG